jgi:predicted lipoprotein with Yx(FWY)xxD motif
MTALAKIEQPVSPPIIIGLVALATLILVLAASGRSSAAPLKGTRVTTTRSNLGPILADSKGKPLYLFARDKHGLSACTGTCASYWPPLLTTDAPVATAGVKATLLGTARRTDGTLQVTYAGHPLYTFKLDSKPRETKGEGTSFFGGSWYVLDAAGATVEKAPARAASPSAAANAGGGGYGY